MLTIAVYRGGELLRRDTIDRNVVKVGRDPRSHVRVDDEAASRMHAILEVASPTDIALIDLGHPAGTLVNGVRVEKCKVRMGDHVQIGATTLVVEDVILDSDAAATESVASLVEAPDDVAARGFAYAFSASGPAVDADDVETHRAAVEVTVLWGSTVIDVVHLAPPRPFWVGEEEGCDVIVPSGALGPTRAPLLVTSDEGTAWLVFPRFASGHVDIRGAGRVSIEDLVASGRARPSPVAAGAHELSLPEGTQALVQIGMSLSFVVSAVRAGRRLPAGLGAVTDRDSFAYAGLSFLVHAGIVAAFAFFMPQMGRDAADVLDRDGILAMQRLLDAAAEREHERPPADAIDARSDAREGGTGASAKGEGGAMGSATSHETGHKRGVQGPRDNPDPHLARMAILAEAQTFGLPGYLSSQWSADPNAPTAPWGRDDSLGKDSQSERGGFWGDRIADAAGPGGLGLTGTGQGNDGKWEGIGLHDIGGVDHDGGAGPGDGIGGHGGPHGGHQVRAPRVRELATSVNGRLPAEAIQRIVRQNFGRFRYCYEKGLRTDPGLRGRVSVKFALDRTGSVLLASDGGSDLPDRGVIQCVVTGFGDLSFPKPEGGVVTVVYPILFSPGD